MPLAAALSPEGNAAYSLTHVSNARLLRELKALLVGERASQALIIAHIAEVEARRLYAPAGCPSMFVYCVERLHLSEDAAYRRIRVARAARQFPVLFEAIADGRLHLAAVSAIAPFLSAENVGELIEAATHRRKSDIEEFLASRFPSATPEPRTVVRPIAAGPALGSRACETDHDQLVLGRVETENELVLGRVGTDVSDSNSTTSLSRENETQFLVQVAIPKATHDKLRKAQALLSHVYPNGDVAQVLDRALDTLIAQLETRKVGALRSRVKSGKSGAHAPARYIPAQVRRAVWERDGGRCTFTGEGGHRCSETRFLEFDHVEPFARGGRATVDGLRLRCRAHNQHEAERVYGSGFMEEKRKAKREIEDVAAGLRGLGCNRNEARRAAEFACQQAGTIEERMRFALQSIARRSAS